MASEPRKTTTIKVDKDLHRELKIKAAKEDRKLEEVVEEALRKSLEKSN